MLVYYLKERTMIGRTGDIQFFGVGIQVNGAWSNKKVMAPGVIFIIIFLCQLIYSAPLGV